MIFDLTMNKKRLPPDVDIIITNLLVPSLKPDINYVYNEDTGSSSVTINHNLNKIPSVTIINDSGESIIGNVKYLDSNTLICSFDEVFVGKIVLN